MSLDDRLHAIAWLEYNEVEKKEWKKFRNGEISLEEYERNIEKAKEKLETYNQL